MNFNDESKKTPEILLASKHKPINPDKIPKRKKVVMPAFIDMTNEQLFATMATSLLGINVDKNQYASNQRYKAEVDWIFNTGVIAMATLFLRDNDVNVGRILEENQSRFEEFERKQKILRV